MNEKNTINQLEDESTSLRKKLQALLGVTLPSNCRDDVGTMALQLRRLASVALALLQRLQNDFNLLGYTPSQAYMVTFKRDLNGNTKAHVVCASKKARYQLSDLKHTLSCRNIETSDDNVARLAAEKLQLATFGTRNTMTHGKLPNDVHVFVEV